MLSALDSGGGCSASSSIDNTYLRSVTLAAEALGCTSFPGRSCFEMARAYRGHGSPESAQKQCIRTQSTPADRRQLVIFETMEVGRPC